jgi:hypothetical protein
LDGQNASRWIDSIWMGGMEGYGIAAKRRMAGKNA